MKMRVLILTSLLLILALLIQPWQVSSASTTSTSGEITIFDFAENAAYAQWRSGAGDLPFPGTAGDYRGYVQRLPSPILEDGTRGLMPGLLVVPHNKVDGYLQGIYPEYTVQKNDRFQAVVGCEYGASGCYVTFRLDYITSEGIPKIFWQWKEKYDNRGYSVDLDLSALAGKKVRFVLTLLASGTANGDRAIWFFPRLARRDNSQPTLPALTPTATPFSTPPAVSPAKCDRATFVTDVTVPDGTTFAPGEAFTKGWQLRNAGTCTWSKDYALVFYSGDQLGAPTVINLPWAVAPGKTIELAVNAIAPQTAGTYQSYWVLRNAAGQFFGIGSSGAKPFWMLIKVSGSAPVSKTGYDFVANLCSAQWQSGAGALPCPQTDGDSRGFVLAKDQDKLEDGQLALPVLLTQPQDKYNGYIQGTYPTFTVQPGDRFRALLGCEQNANCYVTYRLEYLTAGGAPRIFWQWTERNDGKTYSADVDLTPLAGQSLRFVLTTLAAGPATGDRALWAGPRILRLGLFPPAPTMLPTSTPESGPGTSVSSPVINSLSMLDASNGWALGDNSVLRTTNGGATWRKVLDNVSIGGSYFQNSTNAWVLQNPGVLYRTSNGGYTWTQYDVPFNTGQLQFLNNNGFLMTGGPIGMFKYPITLYQSTDGGAHWTLKFTHEPPGVGDGLDLSGYKFGLTFRDTKNGWIGGGNYPGDGYFYLFRTTDGGVNWTRVQPALPVGYEAAYIDILAPKFFSTTEGILPVWMSIGAGMRDLFLYVSHDGGNTWTPSAGYARNAVGIDFISTTNAVSWDSTGNLYSTSNAGGSWTKITPNVNFGGSYRGLDFISPTTGWLSLPAINGKTPFYHTTDGGYTWTLLSGGSNPVTDPAVFAQAMVDALNARNFTLVKSSLDQTVAFAYWQSQGNAVTPEQAIESFRTFYLGTTTLVADPTQDLTVLLGGYNPYAIMGLDPAKSYALYVSGWGLDGRTEGILYLTRRADDSLYFFGLLFAPNGFIHTPPTATATPTPTATLTPSTDGWPVFTNPNYGFQLKYPPSGFVSSQSAAAARIELPVLVSGTNLESKFLNVKVSDGVQACSTTGMFVPLPDVPAQNVVINGFNFTKEQGTDGAMGHATRYVAYSTLKGQTCLYLVFALRYANPNFYDPPLTVFDFALESVIFDQMMSTFAWPELPTGTVMAVNLAADVGTNSCSPGPVLVELTGEIAVNGPATVTYHWEIVGDSVQGVTPDQTLTFSEAAIQTVTTAFNLPCGSHAILLHVTSPTVISGQVNVPLYPLTATATATETPTPTLTPSPSATTLPPTPGFTSPYALLGVSTGHTLLIYSSYTGADKTIIAEFPAEAKSIERGMYTNLVDGIRWVYVYSPEKHIGWVDDQYLTEYVTPATFAADPRTAVLISNLKLALSNGDGNLLASLVSPKHGVRIGYHGSQGPGIVFTPDQARNILSSTESFDWGAEGASGREAVGTFSEIVKPKLLDALNASYELAPDTVRYAYMYSEPWPSAYQNLNFLSLLKPPSSDVFDWREWLVGIEYVNGTPYIVSLFHYIWEP